MPAELMKYLQFAPLVTIILGYFFYNSYLNEKEAKEAIKNYINKTKYKLIKIEKVGFFDKECPFPQFSITSKSLIRTPIGNSYDGCSISKKITIKKGNSEEKIVYANYDLSGSGIFKKPQLYFVPSVD